jgi:alkanesulfonate monooxygenase SsuD/methylene tetrahydromethanopterin reductase-like flavin-dependent oxidoreductase (luciferase family)
MEFGAHLPLIAFDREESTLEELRAFTATARDCGFRYLCANDHLLFQRPWLDGPTALAAVIADSGDMTLATTIALPVIRGPLATAKMFAAIDSLSGGRFAGGVGPGSSARDYEAVGIPFDERWSRFDDALPVLRSHLRPDLPLWVASWGSAAGMRRVTRYGDAWLASGYNITPEQFAERSRSLPDNFPNAVGTFWMYITEDRREAERMLSEVLAPVVHRDIEALTQLALPIGSAEQCAERMQAWADAGVQRAFVWPLRDEQRQLELFAEIVGTGVAAAKPPPPG